MNTSFNPVETQLAHVWQQLLAQQPNHDSHFFAMGGNSLLLIRLSIGISEQMGLSIDVSGLLKNPRFADMAKHLEEKVATQLPQYDRRQPFTGTAVPLTFAQRSIWQALRAGSGSENHNMPFALHILSHIDVERFRQAVAALMARHRVLTAQICVSEDGEPVMQPNVYALELQLTDLAACAAADRSARLTALEYDLFSSPINALNGPLAEMRLVTLADDEHYVYFNIHHIVFDGVSYDVWLRELMSLYAQASLPPLVVDYFDYAQWTASPAYRTSLQPGLSYWRQRLGAHRPAVLPWFNPASTDATGAYCSGQLSIRPLQALRALAQRHDTTLFVVFAVALQIVLKRHQTAGDTAFGAYTAQRIHADFAQTLGNFINPTLVRRDWHETQTLAQALRTQHQYITQDFEWQHVPHEAIVAAWAAEGMDASPELFNVSLVFNEHVLQKEHRQAGLHLKLESHATHRIDFAFDTDIEFMAHTDAEGLCVAAAYKQHKVGEALMHLILDELLAVLARLADVNPTIVMAELMQPAS